LEKKEIFFQKFWHLKGRKLLKLQTAKFAIT